MAMQINTNVLSLTAQRNAAASQASLATSIERLSTGLRINSAGDDAAGLAISERFTSQIRGQSVAQRNANDAISFAQTAEGALGVVSDVLQRMRELTIQSLNGLNTPGDREAIQEEMVQLREEVERIAQDTTFNGKKILNGGMGQINFQIGAGRGDVLSMTGVDAKASVLGGDYTTAQAKKVAGANPGEVDFSAITGSLTINGTNVAIGSAASSANIVSAINTAFPEGNVTASAVSTTHTFTYNGNAANTSIQVKDSSGATQTISTGNGSVAKSGADIAAELDALDGLSAEFDGTDVKITTDGFDLDVVADGSSVLFGTVPATYASAIEVVADGETLTIADGGTGAAAALGLDQTAVDTTMTRQGYIADVSVLTVDAGNESLSIIDTAIDQVTSLRATLGAMQNRFENVVEVIGIHRENLESARSRILDADFAAETANLTRAQILQQAGLSSLAQANSVPQSVLSLLQ